MDHASDPVGRLKPPRSSPALLAMLGAVAVTAGLKALPGWPARRSSASNPKTRGAHRLSPRSSHWV